MGTALEYSESYFNVRKITSHVKNMEQNRVGFNRKG